MTWIVLATEDELSEKVGLRLAKEAGLEVGQCLRRNGFGYLKSRMGSFCQMARHQPVFIITDLDRTSCPSRLVNDWLRGHIRPERLVFRVAVREVEAWLLADHEAMKNLLGQTSKLPAEPDGLLDPKKTLLQLAQRASRDVRDDLVVRKGVVASQGLGYNARLGEWVQKKWLPERAAARSPSLQKALARLKGLL